MPVKFKIVVLFTLLLGSYTYGQTKRYVDPAYDYFNKRNYPEALKLFKERLEKNKNATYLLDVISQCYIKMDSIPQAKHTLEEAI